MKDFGGRLNIMKNFRSPILEIILQSADERFNQFFYGKTTFTNGGWRAG